MTGFIALICMAGVSEYFHSCAAVVFCAVESAVLPPKQQYLFFFPFPLHPGHSLTQFVRHCADHFLNSEHKEIRMEAARTCSRLLTPSIHLISGHAHVVSQTAVQVVADVLSKLLVVGITDPGKC